MLSKTELEFLKNPSSFDANYAKSLRHRINTKTRELKEEMQLLARSGIVAENSNPAAEFSNPKKNAERALSLNQGQSWSLRRDLDPRPLPYQGNAPPG